MEGLSKSSISKATVIHCKCLNQSVEKAISRLLVDYKAKYVYNMSFLSHSCHVLAFLQLFYMPERKIESPIGNNFDFQTWTPEKGINNGY